jgi:uncharacterized membrane protein
VVQGHDEASPELLVPVTLIAETTSTQITLKCSLEEMSTLSPFVETQYIRNELADPTQGDFVLPYAVPMATDIIQVDEEKIPPGQLAVQRGTPVEATDGAIGTVDEFLVDPDSYAITHFVLTKGHLWGKKELTLPVSAVDRVFDGVVYLKIDKKSIETLPTIPVRRSWGYSGADIELVMLIFDGVDRAAETITFMKSMKREGIIAKIRNYAVLTKDANGKISVEENKDVDKKHGAIFGAITGGIVGLLGGPVGAVIGAAAGAATGGVAAGKIDMGFSNKYLESLQAELKPDSSAIIAVIEHEWSGDVTSALTKHGGRVFTQALPPPIVAQLISETEE